MPVPTENTSPRRSTSSTSKTKLSSKLSGSSHHSNGKNRASGGSVRSSSSKNKSKGSLHSSNSNSLNGSRRTTSKNSHHSSTSRGISRRPSTTRGRSVINSPERRSSRRAGEPQSPGKKANRPATVSTFLRNTHRELKQQIATIQGQISFIQDLATMRVEKKISLLFEMIDRDGGGTVDAEELATAMRQNDELSFSDSIEKAIDMVATFDADKDGELDADEFQVYVSAMVDELGVSSSDFCEFLIVQLLLTKETPEEKLAGELAREHINEEVKAREKLFEILSNDRMTELFSLFDEEDTGEASFQEVAMGLYQFMEGVDDETYEAMEVLLMMDKNDTRMLDYEAFGRLIMSVSKATDRSFKDIADGLTLAVNTQDEWEDDFGSELIVEGSVSERGSIMSDEAIDSLTYKRLKKLFDLWDVDRDGDISLSELSNGLQVFQAAYGITVDAHAIAQALIKFDEEGDEHLDPRQFARAMVQYAKQFGADMHELIDFMCTTASQGIHKKKSRKSRSRNNFDQTFTTARRIPDVEEDEPDYIEGDVDFWE